MAPRALRRFLAVPLYAAALFAAAIGALAVIGASQLMLGAKRAWRAGDFVAGERPRLRQPTGGG